MKLPENMVYDKTAETVFVATPADVVRFNKTQLGERGWLHDCRQRSESKV